MREECKNYEIGLCDLTNELILLIFVLYLVFIVHVCFALDPLSTTRNKRKVTLYLINKYSLLAKTKFICVLHWCSCSIL